MSVMVSVAVSQVGMTKLIFVNPGVKVKGQYYCNVLLSQQMLPAIKRVAKRSLFTNYSHFIDYASALPTVSELKIKTMF